MKFKAWISAVAILFAAGFLGCKDEPTSPDGTGTLVVRLVQDVPAMDANATAVADQTSSDPAIEKSASIQAAVRPQASASAAMLDAVRVALVGPTPRTVNLSQTAGGFEGTITGLEPGTYSLLVQGLETGLVEFLGAATGINVVAGQTADAAVSVFGFVTTLDPVSNVDDVSLTFDVTFTDVGIATEYLVEVSPDRDFPTGNILFFPTTQTSVTLSVPWPGVYFVRVRAGNDVVSPDEALPSDRRVVDFLTFGQVDGRTSFLTVPDEVEAYGFTAQAGDGIVVIASATDGLLLSRIGEARLSAHHGAAGVNKNKNRTAAATLASQAMVDLDIDARLRPIFDTDGNPDLLGGNNNIGGFGTTYLSNNGDEMIVALANNGGTKTVELRPVSGSGEYNVFVSDCDVTRTPIGNTVGGDLNSSDCETVNPWSWIDAASGAGVTHADIVAFDGSAADRVTVSLTSESFDPVLFLWGPDGSLLAVNDDASEVDLNSRISSFSLPVDGTYTALVTSYWDFETGPYSLTVADASPGVPSQVVFTLSPFVPVTVRTPFTVVAEIRDSDNNLVPTAAVDVTLQLFDNPGSLIFRASGVDVDGRMELVDPVTLDVLPPVSTGQPHIIMAMTYDATSDRVFAEDEFDDLFTIDPLTGTQTFVGPVQDPFGSSILMKGLAFEQPGGRLLGADAFSDVIYEIDPATGDATDIGTVIAASPIDGFNGLAVDPTDGTLYAVTRFDSFNREVRNLITIDLSTFNATDLGQLAHDGVAGIAFLPNGRLHAVIGDGGRIPLPDPETLWSVDKTNPAVMNFQTGLGGTGGGGEAIATVPGQLVGTTTVTTLAGIGVFTDVEINAPGSGYTIEATAPGLIRVISALIDVNP
jgi:hypothetical protein